MIVAVTDFKKAILTSASMATSRVSLSAAFAKDIPATNIRAEAVSLFLARSKIDLETSGFDLHCLLFFDWTLSCSVEG